MIYKITKTGKIRWVKAILAHLVRCISGHRGTDSDDEDEDEGVLNQDSDSHSSAKHWAKTRTLSISSPDHEARNISTDLHIAAVPKELTLDYTEISAVPPLPLWLLLAADQGSANLGDSSTSGSDSLFQPSLETHVIICLFAYFLVFVNASLFEITLFRRKRKKIWTQF